MLPLYDAILVPDEAHHAGGLPVPAAARARVCATGPVMVRERVEVLDRAEARTALGIAEDRLAVYLTAGGGGDGGAEQTLVAGARALLDAGPDIHVVVGAGPLYRSRRLYG